MSKKVKKVIEVLEDRQEIVNRQQIADGLIEFLKGDHKWNYIPLGKDPLKDEAYHRNNICACAIDHTKIPEIAKPSITAERMEEYEGEFISAVVGVQLGLYNLIDEYVEAIDAIEGACEA
jgi:hypothetical protein